MTKEWSTALLKRTWGTGGRQAGCDFPYEDRLRYLGLFSPEKTEKVGTNVYTYLILVI